MEKNAAILKFIIVLNTTESAVITHLFANLILKYAVLQYYISATVLHLLLNIALFQGFIIICLLLKTGG